jgi:hypothetical protein
MSPPAGRADIEFSPVVRIVPRSLQGPSLEYSEFRRPFIVAKRAQMVIVNGRVLKLAGTHKVKPTSMKPDYQRK